MPPMLVPAKFPIPKMRMTKVAPCFDDSNPCVRVGKWKESIEMTKIKERTSIDKPRSDDK
jgi:hypothetical protein